MVVDGHAPSECQRTDWHKGLPRPHKHFCGRHVDERLLDPPSAKPQEPKPLTMDDFLFPYPAPGYKRSPALTYQINNLRKYREQGDYMVGSINLLWGPFVDEFPAVPGGLNRSWLLRDNAGEWSRSVLSSA